MSSASWEDSDTYSQQSLFDFQHSEALYRSTDLDANTDDRIASVFEQIADSIENERDVLLWMENMEDYAKGLTCY